MKTISVENIQKEYNTIHGYGSYKVLSIEETSRKYRYKVFIRCLTHKEEFYQTYENRKKRPGGCKGCKSLEHRIPLVDIKKNLDCEKYKINDYYYNKHNEKIIILDCVAHNNSNIHQRIRSRKNGVIPDCIQCKTEHKVIKGKQNYNYIRPTKFLNKKRKDTVDRFVKKLIDRKGNFYEFVDRKFALKNYPLVKVKCKKHSKIIEVDAYNIIKYNSYKCNECLYQIQYDRVLRLTEKDVIKFN